MSTAKMNTGRYKYQNKNKNTCHFQQQRGIMFLPIMLCSRSSLKDVKLSNRRNSKVTGISPSGHQHDPNLNSSAGKSIHCTTAFGSFKYQNLKNLFSSKSRLTSAYTQSSKSTSIGENPTESKHRRSRSCAIGSKCDGDTCDFVIDRDLNPVKPINIAELDPPLPVPARPVCGGEEEKGSLWKRRIGGATLRSLQVQSIHGGGAIPHSAEANTV